MIYFYPADLPPPWPLSAEQCSREAPLKGHRVIGVALKGPPLCAMPLSEFGLSARDPQRQRTKGNEEVIDYELDKDGIAHIIWNNPDGPVNVKTPAAVDAFARAVDRAINDDAVKGALIRSAKRDYVAGGDLMALYAIQTPEEAEAMVAPVGACLRAIERSSKPFVAVITGSALGGGLEVALACHRRVASDDARVQLGCPEVNLGLIPGAGGTQRLPRLIGIAPATKMLLEGKPIGVQEALGCGLVDEIVPADQALDAARRWVLDHPSAQQAWDREGFQYPGFQPNSAEGQAFFDKAFAERQRKSPPQDVAPHAVLEVLREGLAVDIDAGLAIEARRFGTVAISPSAKNRIRTQFIATGAVRKAGQSGAGAATFTPTRIGVVGAGTMGGGIALVCARSGIETVLIDRSDEEARKGMDRIAKTLDAAVARQLMGHGQRDEALSRIEATTDFGRLEGCQAVVEAVAEIAEVKSEVFRKIFDAAGPDVLVASNTSTLSITKMAETVQTPGNFIGLHFFAPVDRMALVEVVMGSQTSAESLARSKSLLKLLGKTPVVVNDGPGFYTSRVVAAYSREALQMLGEGISPELIDKAAAMAGFPIGPLAMGDLTSYDLLKNILTSLAKAGRGTAVQSQPALDVIDRLLRAGRVGRKGAGGVYSYGPTGKTVWDELPSVFPPQRQQPEASVVMERLLNMQSIETTHVVAEGIASDPLALDLGAVLGWSYPAFRGGVLAHIDQVGLRQFVKRSDEMATEFGPRYVVPALLREMAASGASFHASH